MAIIKCPNCGTSCENDRISCPSCYFALEGSQFQKNELTDEELGKVAKWYYMNGDEQKGPYRLTQMKAFVEEFRVRDTTIVFTENSNEKTKAMNTILFPEKNVKFVNPGQLSSKTLWLLCLIPPIVMLFPYLLGLKSILWYVLTFILSITIHFILLIMDMKYLKNNCNKFGKWTFLGLIQMIPIYPYIRAAKTNKSFAPAIISTGLYFITISVSVATFIYNMDMILDLISDYIYRYNWYSNLWS